MGDTTARLVFVWVKLRENGAGEGHAMPCQLFHSVLSCTNASEVAFMVQRDLCVRPCASSCALGLPAGREPSVQYQWPK